MKRFLVVLALVFIVFACNKPSAFKINGVITNSPATKIYLEKLEINGSTPFDSSKIDKNGYFSLSGFISCPTFFLLKLDQNKFITLLLDSLEMVQFSADYINFTKEYSIEGSPGSKKVQELIQQLNLTHSRVDSIQSLILLNQSSSVVHKQIKEWQQEIYDIFQEHQEFSTTFIINNPFSMASVLAIYQKFNNGEYIVQDLHTIKVAASALQSMYPNSVHVKTLYQDTRNLMESVRNYEIQEFIKKTGVNSPEIILPDPTGKEIALSSLRGKYVLLHFWSAYDRDSRIMNPVLKENYQKFQARRFEIYQVCIDTCKADWLSVIASDKLNWINVGDMNGSVQAVSSYNVQTVPFNYLLDKSGTIVAKDLRGPALYNKLHEILN